VEIERPFTCLEYYHPNTVFREGAEIGNITQSGNMTPPLEIYDLILINKSGVALYRHRS
jgi:hypothetical protein